MEPAITIVDYLWDSRKEWFRHENDDCTHSFEDLVEEFLDNIHVGMYLEIATTDDGPVAVFHHLTKAEWNDLVGPGAQGRLLSQVADAYIGRAMDLFRLVGQPDSE